jgi:hypothetical protein
MPIFDVLEVWWLSMQLIFAAFEVNARFDRSPTDRLNPSCCLNLRRNDYEADLLVWETGAAELTIGEIDGSISQIHFDDVRQKDDLVIILSKLADFILMSQSKRCKADYL